MAHAARCSLKALFLGFAVSLKGLAGHVLGLLRYRAEDVVDIRVSRWGHPLPLGQPGLIADGVSTALRQPFRKRVFFAEQDNWSFPALETAVVESLAFAPSAKGVALIFKARLISFTQYVRVHCLFLQERCAEKVKRSILCLLSIALFSIEVRAALSC